MTTITSKQRVLILGGSGFLGRAITRICQDNSSLSVVLASRRRRLDVLAGFVQADITSAESLSQAIEPHDVVVNLVGIMYPQKQNTFEAVQWRGLESLAKVVKAKQARLVHISAIGANPQSDIPYAKTKGLGELAVRDNLPEATILRPSLIFGPEDQFFNRFNTLSKYLPFLPVFGGGNTRYQPVYVNDLAEAVYEIILNPSAWAGKTIECGGPKVYTYREMMQLVLTLGHRWRPIISLPFWVGLLQGWVLEKLPESIFTLTRDQVRLLRIDNICTPTNNNEVLQLQDVLKRPGETIEQVAPLWFK